MFVLHDKTSLTFFNRKKPKFKLQNGLKLLYATTKHNRFERPRLFLYDKMQ